MTATAHRLHGDDPAIGNIAPVRYLRRWWLAAILASASLFLLAAPIGHAFAATTHVFDPVLSLTGNCETDSSDLVPDPGCPGGVHPGRFNVPVDETTDEYGDIYVDNEPALDDPQEKAVIDIFNSSGEFVTEVPDHSGANRVAVDSEGNLYVERRHNREFTLVRYEPEVYEPEAAQTEPAAGKIKYKATPTVVVPNVTANDIAVDRTAGPLKDHLFVLGGGSIAEYGSAAEGNPLLDATIGQGELSGAKWFAIDGSDGDIYVDSVGPSQNVEDPAVVKVLDGSVPGHPLKEAITGACLPAGHFASNVSEGVSVAVDEGNGHVFVDDRQGANGTAPPPVYEFKTGGTGEEECVSAISHNFLLGDQVGRSGIAIDNGAHSPNGALAPLGRHLFVPSAVRQSTAHLFAFGPTEEGPPKLEGISFSGVTESEAQLRAEIGPEGAETHYAFEYATQAEWEADGESFARASVAGEGTLAAAAPVSPVTAPLVGLAPGTRYRFRVVAENEPSREAHLDVTEEGSLTTYPVLGSMRSCSNAALRLGASASLPDCRAYELVSPPDTGGRPLYDPGEGISGQRLGTPTATSGGQNLAFLTQGGAIPGTDAVGGPGGSPYAATRTEGGWNIESVGLTGAQAVEAYVGGLSPDHGYGISGAAIGGTLFIEEGLENLYVRHPDGSMHLLGQGALGNDPAGARALFLAPRGTHVIFSSSRDLEAGAPPTGTLAIYDRTADEVTHVISLLPGNVTPAEHGSAEYLGASADGRAVAFRVGVGSHLYIRLDDSETVEAAGPGATFEGLSAEGRYAFFLSGGDLYRYDTESEATARITESGGVTVVNVASDGTAAYFVSPSVIPGTGDNPNGAEPQLGAENLYRWDGATISFVATVTERDMKGEVANVGPIDGLGLWLNALARGTTPIDPSRSTTGGEVLLFSSRANLTEYKSGGHAEVYRYDSLEGTLICLSCSPTGAPAASEASLESVSPTVLTNIPTSQYALIPNLSSNGSRAFFQTSDSLVRTDTDGVQDVYEWEAGGEGSCATPGGCVSLISPGQSAHDNYIFGASETGGDVFISSSDLLVPGDGDETPSLYDARVEGGFPSQAIAGECLGEACQPPASAIQSPTPGSLSFQGPGNVQEAGKPAKCAKGKVRKHGKCVKKKAPGKHKAPKKKASKKRHHQAHKTGRAGR